MFVHVKAVPPKSSLHNPANKYSSYIFLLYSRLSEGWESVIYRAKVDCKIEIWVFFAPPK